MLVESADLGDSRKSGHLPYIYLRVIFFGTPYTCVIHGIRQSNRIFSCGEISAFFAKMFFFISVVILNSSLYYQIFEFDIDIDNDIQILVWIIGSTYRKGEILKQKWHVNVVNHQFYHCYTR